MKAFLTTTAIVTGVALWPCAALAQDAEVAQASTAPQASEQSGAQISEIVVTARRRAESVQKSSLTISVLGADELARRGVADAKDLTTTNPSVTISQSGSFTQTNIRGSGDTALNSLSQTAVSYSVDGVVNGQATGISQNFYDLARVEILKGPQGTLYGRNATAGAVNLITNRPTQDLGGYITAEYGNYDATRLTGALNVPLSSTLAVRGAFNIVDRDGYLSDGTDDDVRQSGRLQAYWEPSDVVNLRLYADFSHTGGKGGGIVLFPRQPGTGSWTSAANPINNAAVAAGTFGFQAPYLTDARIDLKQRNLSAELNVKLGDFATLTVLPGYRYLHLNQITNTIGFRGVYDPQTTKQTSLEVRLGHESDKLKWVVGGFYYNDKSHFTLDAIALQEPTFIQAFNVHPDLDSINRSYAAFGEATFSLTDSLRVIGGLRYTHDLVTFNGLVYDRATPPSLGSPFVQDSRRTFNAVTWRAGLEYDVAPSSMLYFTASKGYKAGGFFYVYDAGSDNSYGPERLTTFSLGSRNRFFDNRLQVNLELFYSQYRDQQLTAVAYTASGVIAYLTRNAGKSDPRGASLDVIWKPTSDDTLSFNFDYVRAKFSEFNIEYPAALIGSLRAGPLCSVPAAPGTNANGLPVYNISCAGAPLPRTPKFAGSVSYEHVFDLGSSGRLAFNANATLASSRYVSIDFFVPETYAKGYAVFNADLTYTPDSRKWSVTGFIKNISKEAVYNGGIASPVNGFGGPGSPTFVTRTIAPPRTYGIRATYNF